MPAAKRLFYGYFFFGWIVFFLYYFFWWKIVLECISWGLALILIFYIIYYIIQSAFHAEPRGFIEFFILYLYKISISLSLLIIIIGGFCYYQNNISPANLPLYTLSNGKKIIKFQTMSHIGRYDFYDSIVLNIGREKSNGYILFYEGVKPGKEENMALFQKLLGFQFWADFYQKYSNLYGVVAQDNSKFLGIRNKKDFNVDLSIDDIIQLYVNKTLSEEEKEQYKKDLKLWKGETILYSMNMETEDSLDSEVFKRLSNLDEKSLVAVRYFNTALLNYFIKHTTVQDFLLEKVGKQDIFSVILEERDSYLAQELQKSKFDKIYLLYGFLHFEWVFNILQKEDPNWKIVKEESFYPITKVKIPSF